MPIIKLEKYVCECGKDFATAQSFNGHKSNCIEHLIKVGKITSKEEWLKQKQIQQSKSIKSLAKNTLIKKQKQLQQWISEQHKCEKCGKIMAEKFGSGRFCCRACANSKEHSEETKEKISLSLNNNQIFKQNKLKIHNKVYLDYQKNPKKCIICNKIIPFEKRFNKCLCGDPECHKQYMSLALKKAHAEGRHAGFIYHNQESYPEKYFKQILLTYNIPFESQFPVYNGKNYYHLDFKLYDNIDLEIDGRLHEDEKQKVADQIRDNFMISCGYKIYRFKWVDPKKVEYMQYKIEEFLNWLSLQINTK